MHPGVEKNGMWFLYYWSECADVSSSQKIFDTPYSALDSKGGSIFTALNRSSTLETLYVLFNGNVFDALEAVKCPSLKTIHVSDMDPHGEYSQLFPEWRDIQLSFRNQVELDKRLRELVRYPLTPSVFALSDITV